jgi:hypothetical protein
LTDGMPDWSPDGKRIVFASFREGLHGIFIMNADGSDQQRLTSQVYAQRPKWSPDGGMIAYDGDGDGDTWQDLFVIPAVGGAKTMIVNGPPKNELYMGSWSPDAKSIDYSHVEYKLYQGQYYWTYSTNYRFYIADNRGWAIYELPSMTWNVHWQTTDAAPPQVTLAPLSALSPAAGFHLFWTGQDVGLAGSPLYEVQMRDSGGHWVTWQSGLRFTRMAYTATPGARASFRIIARDAAFNASAPTPEVSTRFYTTLLSGRITDNRGTPVESANFSLTPPGLEDGPMTDVNGRYAMPLTAKGPQGIWIGHNELQARPSLTLPFQNPMPFSPYLLAGDNRLINGGLDGSLSGWTTGGTQQPVYSAEPFIGAGSARLGASCLIPCLGAPQSLGQPRLHALDAAADAQGNVHVLWAGHLAASPGDTGYYHSLRAPNGEWTAYHFIQAFQGSEPVIAVDPAGAFHALWQSPRGQYQYIYRNPAGAWSTVQTVANTTAPFPAAMVSDRAGNLHVIFSEREFGSHYYMLKPVGGGWKAPVDLDLLLDMRVTTKNLAVGPDGVVTIAARVVDDHNDTTPVFALITRTPAGQWGVQYGGPTMLAGSVLSMAFAPDGALHLIHMPGSHDQLNYHTVRDAAGGWSDSVPLPNTNYFMDAAIDARGRLHHLSGVGAAYSIWTPGLGWSSPASLNVAYGVIVIDPNDLPHIVGIAPDGQTADMRYVGPALAAAAATSTLWQQVTIPADMSAPTLTFMQRRHGEPPGGSGLTAFVDEAGTITPLTLPPGRPAWSMGWVDLSPWAGKTVKVGFTLNQAAGEPYAAAWIDDVSLSPAYADLVVRGVMRSSVPPGGQTELRIDVFNQGGVAATGVSVSLSPDDEFTFVSSDPPPTSTSGKVRTWQLGDFAANSPVKSVIVRLAAPARPPQRQLTNQMDVFAAQPEPLARNNTQYLEVLVGYQAFMPRVLR